MENINIPIILDYILNLKITRHTNMFFLVALTLKSKMIQGDQKMTDLKTASHQTHLKLKDCGDSEEGGSNCHSQGPHKNNEVP